MLKRKEVIIIMKAAVAKDMLVRMKVIMDISQGAFLTGKK
jgi:hypothetical protein